MPGGSNNQKNVKTVQTLLAAKKTGNNEEPNEKPSKQSKRTHSDVAEESIEGIDLESIHQDLAEIKQALKGTAQKSDLDCLVKEKDLKDLVTDIVKQLLVSFEETVSKEIVCRVKDATGKLQDELDTLSLENHNLKERIREKDKIIDRLEEKVQDVDQRSLEALKLGNYNEQYSRKQNIRILNYTEKKDENLKEDFLTMVNQSLKLDIEPSDILAIHRIPGRKGMARPVIAKFRTTDVKVSLMKKKRELKGSVKFHDDITKRNLGLLTRLKNSGKFENVWFFNCSVYAKAHSGEKIKFDILDNIEKKLSMKVTRKD